MEHPHYTKFDVAAAAAGVADMVTVLVSAGRRNVVLAVMRAEIGTVIVVAVGVGSTSAGIEGMIGSVAGLGSGTLEREIDREREIGRERVGCMIGSRCWWGEDVVGVPAVVGWLCCSGFEKRWRAVGCSEVVCPGS